jgi:hypothetical protein
MKKVQIKTTRGGDKYLDYKSKNLKFTIFVGGSGCTELLDRGNQIWCCESELHRHRIAEILDMARFYEHEAKIYRAAANEMRKYNDKVLKN